MTPNIQHLGHACLKFTNAGVKLVTDPWFYPAFCGSWFPYPDNRHLVQEALDADYIYISHAHEDHFDRKFLAQVDPTRTTIIIPKFRSGYLQKELAKLGFYGMLGPVILNHGGSTELPGDIKLTVFTDRSHKEDSALLVDCGGFRFLNSNDCELAIPDWPDGVDLLACQFSGAFWYPHCYDFPAEVQAAKSREVVMNNLERLVRRITLTGARGYLPSAGPAVFLDPDLQKFNKPGGIFPSWEQVADYVQAQFDGALSIWPYLNHYTDVQEYSHARRSEWGAYYSMPDRFVTEEELKSYFRQYQSFNKRFLRDWHKDILVESNSWIAGDTRQWNIRLGLAADQLEEAFNPEYVMDVPPRLLRAIVDERITWETALQSMRIKLHRDPDTYDNTFMGLLAFGDRPIQTLTMAKQQADGEMINHNGVTHQRWCPHAGEDLTFATVADGKITCPRHEWCWDAETGACLTGQGVDLRMGHSPFNSGG